MRCIRSRSASFLATLSLLAFPLALAGRAELLSLELPSGQSIDIHRIQPDEPSDPAPAILMFHGGGWTGGRPQQLFPHAEAFAEAGFVCLLPAYPLASPQSGIAESTRAAEAISRELLAHADEWNLDRKRLYLLGESAGGHLAGMVAGMPGPSPWAGVILWNPILDLAALRWLEERHGPPEDLASWSPLNRLSGGHPPTLILHGQKDEVVPPAQIEDWFSKAQTLALPVRLELLPGLGHAFVYPENNGAPGKGFHLAMERSLTFLRQPSSVIPLTKDGFQIVHAFDRKTGWQPFAELSRDGDQAWGGTHRGGEHDQGVLFRIDLPARSFELMHSMSPGAGREPYTGMQVIDGEIWGINKFGGPHGDGTLFRFDPETRSLERAHAFGRKTSGNWAPHAAPIELEGDLFGTTFHGGDQTWSGTAYRFSPDDGSSEILQSFSAATGEHLTGQLLFHEGWLYGMTSDYDKKPGRHGSLFRLRPNGSGFALLHKFEGGGLGGHPYDRLVSHPEGFLLGTTFGVFGDPSDRGTVFAFFPEERRLISLVDFNLVPEAGGKPNGTLVMAENGRDLYLTTHGSTDGEHAFPGTALRLRLETAPDDPGDTAALPRVTRVELLHTFDGGSRGHTPMRTPLVWNGEFWGVTAFGNDGSGTTTEPTDTGGLVYYFPIPALQVEPGLPGSPQEIDPAEGIAVRRGSVLAAGIGFIAIAFLWYLRFPGPPLSE